MTLKLCVFHLGFYTEVKTLSADSVLAPGWMKCIAALIVSGNLLTL